MLLGISKLIPPDLLKIMMEMGHGDELVLADANFPSARVAQRLVRCDGQAMPELLDAILKLFQLDQYVDRPVAVMEVMTGDTEGMPIWKQYEEIIRARTGHDVGFEIVERFAFYERAHKGYAVVATGEVEQYANIILKKGVIVE
ncbi:RbsD/FucU family protein [Paenibacillus prosopidis]|uniref:L-fucose mutarotase n=1 Tax=Paenibacillus prosopidis TaxID=630520 RepID=A0A368W452_9BACL|nr:RbsD/FucU domain-containing protein [Paenibacillus prosopidis]RCW49068.1 L-fucose mutarotase [Paenibacillus prosopidis]